MERRGREDGDGGFPMRIKLGFFMAHLLYVATAYLIKFTTSSPIFSSTLIYEFFLVD